MAGQPAHVPTLLNFALDAVCHFPLNRNILPASLVNELAKRMKLKFFYFYFRSKLRRSTYGHPHFQWQVANGLEPGTATAEQAISMWRNFCKMSLVPYQQFECRSEDIITFLNDQVAMGRLKKHNNTRYKL